MKKEVSKYCTKCRKETTHDYEVHIKGNDKTTIAVCRECGESDVKVEPVDICDICEHHECFDCPNINPIDD